MDQGQVVLSAIIPDRRDLLLYALYHLQPEHFRQEILRTLFALLERYYDVAGDVLPPATLSDLLARHGIDDTKQLLYEETYRGLAAQSPADHEFRYAVDALKDLRSQQLTGEAITTSFEILERGEEINGETLKGHDDARSYLYSQLANIDRLNHQESAPEGDVRTEGKEVLEDYATKKSGKQVVGVRSGIPQLDEVSGGFQPGELVLVAAYTGQGKSQCVTQIAWDASVRQGRNVFFATSETVRPQVRRRLFARHSRLPQFDCKDGLNVKDIRDGTLDQKGEEVLKAVVDDLHNNPAYGRLHVAQVPRGATLSFLEAKMRRQGEQWEIDLAVMDYLALLKPDRRRENAQHELNDMLKDAKVMVTSFYNGRGIPLLSPWQMSQKAFKDAVMSGSYQLANLADTSEAEKSPDQIIAILRLEETPNEVKMQYIKNRDSEVPPPFVLQVDYRNAYLGERSVVTAMAASTDMLSMF